MKKFLKEWKKIAILLLLIFGAALFLRVSNLTHLPIFADEAIYIRWAQVMKAESTLRFLPLSDGKQPLFMWSVIPLFQFFSDPLFAGRLVSVLTGAGTTVALFFVGYLLFDDKKVGLLASFIYAISPFSVFFDRMALVDSMLTMFGVLTFLGAILIAKTKRLDIAMLTGFSLGGAFLTKSPSLFFALLLPVTLLVVTWPKRNRKKAILFSKILGLWLVALTIAYGMYNILRLGPNFHMLAQRNRNYVHPVSHILATPLDPFLPFLHRIYQYFIKMGPSVLIFVSALGAIVNFGRKRKEILMILSWGLLPILVNAEFSKTMTARYVLFAVPYFIVLAASAFLAKKGALKRVFVAGIIVFTTHALYLDYYYLTDIENAPLPRSERSGYLEEWTSGIGIREVADYLVEERNKGAEERLVVGTEGYFGTLPDGLQIYLNSYPDITVKGVGVNIDSVPEDLLDAKASGNKVYMLFNTTRLRLRPERVGLKIVAAYPKAVQPDGERETLLLLEVTEDAFAQE